MLQLVGIPDVLPKDPSYEGKMQKVLNATSKYIPSYILLTEKITVVNRSKMNGCLLFSSTNPHFFIKKSFDSNGEQKFMLTVGETKNGFSINDDLPCDAGKSFPITIKDTLWFISIKYGNGEMLKLFPYQLRIATPGGNVTSTAMEVTKYLNPVSKDRLWKI
tara:strand:- start:104 stop:589 length:486 start_codon:yes stop_codon:yes gene_type:complete